MTVDFKSKKLWACVSGVALAALCIVAVSKCTSNAGDRDEAREDLSAQTARADSLQQALSQMTENRDAWYEFAQARGDTIRMLRDDTALTDSIVVLNDSIAHLVAANDSLQRSLNDCRGARRSAPARRRKNNSGRNNNAHNNNGQLPVQHNGGSVNNNNNNNNIVIVPAQPATNVTVNGGNGNTVNVNNGTVNNYYAPAPASNNTVRVRSSASVSTTYVVKVAPAKTR